MCRLAEDNPQGAKVIDIRNNEVVKFEGSAAATVARTLLQAGPSTATDIASSLGLTGAAVRKQLDLLLETGLCWLTANPFP